MSFLSHAVKLVVFGRKVIVLCPQHFLCIYGKLHGAEEMAGELPHCRS